MSNAIADQLRRLLLNGKWNEGDRLPSEDELAHGFRVGRNTIREAVARLMSERLLEIRRGVGTIVRGWLENASLDIFANVLDIKKGTPRERELMRQLLWLRRITYVQLSEPLTEGRPNLERLSREVRLVRFGSSSRYYWNELPALIVSEESLLTRFAFESGNLPATLVATTLARIMFDRIPVVLSPPRLEPPMAQLEQLVQAIADKDRARAAALLDELCRLREDAWLDLLTPVAQSTSTPSSPSAETPPASDHST